MSNLSTAIAYLVSCDTCGMEMKYKCSKQNENDLIYYATQQQRMHEDANKGHTVWVQKIKEAP